MAPGPGLPSTVARLHYFHSVTFNATVLVTSMGREVIFNLPSWPLTKPLLCTVTGSSPVTATELPQPQPQAPSLHESISDPASSRTAKDCHIRRWLIRWHNVALPRGLLPDSDASIARRLAHLRDCKQPRVAAQPHGIHV